MQSIIEDIYYGKRGNAEAVKMNEKYWEVSNAVAEMSKEFMKTLNEEQKKKFIELSWVVPGTEAENALSHYIEGFKIGFNIAVECLTK